MIASFDNVLAIEHSSMDSYESNSPADEGNHLANESNKYKERIYIRVSQF